MLQLFCTSLALCPLLKFHEIKKFHISRCTYGAQCALFFTKVTAGAAVYIGTRYPPFRLSFSQQGLLLL